MEELGRVRQGTGKGAEHMILELWKQRKAKNLTYE